VCSRFAIYGSVDQLHEQFDASVDEFEFTPHYNAAPMQWLPVLRQRPSGERVVHRLRWGLVPSWAKDESTANRLINARCETVAEKPSFRAAHRTRRCIVPATGYYEWQQGINGKQPYFIHAADGSMLGLAGLWERWESPNSKESIDTFTVLTTESNESTTHIHSRMPVILMKGHHVSWLDRTTPLDVLQQIAIPCPAGFLALRPVGKAVGNVKNDWPSLVDPMD
jgi:putative SOS response-associated peptidase YedK